MRVRGIHKGLWMEFRVIALRMGCSANHLVIRLIEEHVSAMTGKKAKDFPPETA